MDACLVSVRDQLVLCRASTSVIVHQVLMIETAVDRRSEPGNPIYFTAYMQMAHNVAKA